MVSIKDLAVEAQKAHDEEVKAKQFMPEHTMVKGDEVFNKEVVIDGVKIVNSNNPQYKENPKTVLIAVTVDGAKKMFAMHNAVIVNTFENAMAMGVEVAGTKAKFTKQKLNNSGFVTNVMEIIE